MGKKRKATGCFAALLIPLFVFLVFIEFYTGGLIPVLKVPLILAFGWIGYLARVIPLINPNREAAIFGIIVLGILGIGAHLFLQWLYSNWEDKEADASIVGRQWRPRWTVAGLVILILMFMTSIAFIGSVHQLGWLIKSDEPKMVSSWAKMNTERSMKSLCQTPFRESISAKQYQARLWRDAQLRKKFRKYHVLAVEGPEGGIGAVVVFPRDPVRRKEMKVLVCRGGSHNDISEHHADELPEILEQLNDGSLVASEE